MNQVFHDFFYQVGSSYHKNYCNVSYNDFKFFSYNTVIGIKGVYDKEGCEVLLLSMRTFSNTTARHRSKLSRACSFGSKSIYYVPFEINDSRISYTSSPEEAKKVIVEYFIKEINKYLQYEKETFCSAIVRDHFLGFYTDAKRFHENIQSLKGFNKLQKLYESVSNSKVIRDWRKKVKETQRKKEEKERKLCSKYLKEIEKMDYFDALAKYLDHKSFKNASDFRLYEKAFALFNEVPFNPSYVWMENDAIKTSMGIILLKQITVVKALLRKWKRKKNLLGAEIDRYKILKVDKKYVKIGCHVIPAKNLEALYLYFFGGKNEEA